MWNVLSTRRVPYWAKQPCVNLKYKVQLTWVGHERRGCGKWCGPHYPPLHRAVSSWQHVAVKRSAGVAVSVTDLVSPAQHCAVANAKIKFLMPTCYFQTTGDTTMWKHDVQIMVASLCSQHYRRQICQACLFFVVICFNEHHPTKFLWNKNKVGMYGHYE